MVQAETEVGHRVLLAGSLPQNAIVGGYDGGSFFIERRWKEEVLYWEGGQGFLFDAAWGVEPPELYAPSPRIWDLVVPAWLAGRHAEVVGRLAAHSGHRVIDDDAGYDWFGAQTRGPSPSRLLTR